MHCDVPGCSRTGTSYEHWHTNLLLLHLLQISVELADLQDQEVGDGTSSLLQQQQTSALPTFAFWYRT
jgi:hypothetical protein